MTLRSRLTLGLLTIAVILIVPLLLAMRSLERLHGEAKALRDRDFAASLLLGRARDALNDLRSAEMAVLFVRDERSRQTMLSAITDVQRLADSLEVYGLGGSVRDVRAAMQAVATGTQQEHEAALLHHDRDAERISSEQVLPALARAEAATRDAERALRTRTRDRVAQAASAAHSGSTAAVIGLVLAVVVAALIAVRLTRSVSRPIYELERGMRQVADGDFDARLDISPSRTDEFGRLAVSFHDMSQQLAELDKIKAEFVSVASHELKTPINVVLGYVQLLNEELYGPLTDKQRKVTIILEQQTQTLSRLVKQLLDVTRFEAGTVRLDVRPLQLPQMLKELEQAFRVLADQRGIRFHLMLHDGVPDAVYWDHDRINEVLGNLLSNAFKFTERGGEVELTVFPVDGGVQMDVHDTGAGIPPEQLPRVFDKFYQADNQRASSRGGSGLGLAIARQIVEAHNGHISVESTPGVGAVFTIVLPERVNARRSSAPQQAVPETV
ncbi:MAG TPA: HAMP domain-containing sensor histidine kinase [Gemmatimonadaceae bacterium]|nr:HAMP domain-containing sensor histidine kinase [Gemmatimonadaceae bacterium]